MFPPSRRTLGVLCIIGFTLAAAGWFQALKQEGPSAAAGDVSARDGAWSTKAGARGTGSADAKIMSDPRSIRLVELMEEMDQSAEAGQPNPAFIKATELTLNDSLFQRRQRDFRMLMEKMRPEDAEAIHRHFKALEREGRYFGLSPIGRIARPTKNRFTIWRTSSPAGRRRMPRRPWAGSKETKSFWVKRMLIRICWRDGWSRIQLRPPLG